MSGWQPRQLIQLPVNRRLEKLFLYLVIRRSGYLRNPFCWW